MRGLCGKLDGYSHTIIDKRQVVLNLKYDIVSFYSRYEDFSNV